MKTSFALGCGFLLLLAVPAVNAQAAARDFAQEMSVDGEVQERFYAKYPDLSDEREVVADAARQLSRQEGGAADANETGQALAARARAMLARRTPQEWQRKAISLFPELGVAGSEFNQLFLERYREMERNSPQFRQEPSWPVLLAKRCAEELRVRAVPKIAANSIPGTPAAGTPVTNASAAAAPGAAWKSALSVMLLFAIVCLPARWLFGMSRAFAGHEEPVTLWQKALRPAVWTYLVVAVIGLFRTFRANVDLGFVDRFGITLLVSVLAGLAFAPVAFGIAWGVGWWQRRAAARAEALGHLPPETSALGNGPVAK